VNLVLDLGVGEPPMTDDVATLLELNAAYIHSDQFSDVERYDHFLAPDFLATLPDLVPRDRRQFLVRRRGRRRPRRVTRGPGRSTATAEPGARSAG
jgi:hypothetical protein